MRLESVSLTTVPSYILFVRPKLILDFDGTVVDDANRHWRVFMEVTGLWIEKDKYWALRRIGNTNADVLRNCGSEDVFDLDEFRILIEDKEYLTLDRLIPKDETLQYLCCHFEVILCTIRSDKKNLEWQVDNLGIRNYLHRMVVIPHQELNFHKSKAMSLRAFLGTDFASTDIIIGDTEVDVRTGRELGIRTYAVESGIRCREYLQKLYPDLILSDLNQLVVVK